MKKNIIILMLGLLAFACSPPLENGSAYDIELSADVVNFKSEETATKTIKVNTEDKNWTAKAADAQTEEWLEVGANLFQNTLAIKPKSQNTNTDTRHGVVLVSTSSGTKTIELAVNQLGVGPEILLNTQSVDIGVEGRAEIAIDVTSNIQYDVIKPDWVEQVVKGKAMQTSTLYFKVGKNETGRVRSGDIIFKSKDPSIEKQATVKIVQQGGASIDVPKDTKIMPVAARALGGEFQPGAEIGKSYDNDMTTAYHSRWGDGTVMPVTLEYDLPTSATQLDYIIYYTRQDGGNGSFGAVELWANTYTDATMVKLGDWDFGQAGGGHSMILTAPILAPKTVRFIVKNGTGGFASCAEMEFYTYAKGNDAQTEAINQVFASQACMEVKQGVTDEQIAALPGALQEVAVKMIEGTYPLEFRCESYKAYSTPSKWATLNVTRPYSNLDNPTGIEVKAGEKFYVYVGDTWGNNISLLCVDNLLIAGQTFMLRTGVNEFTPTKNGQLFVQYFVDDLGAPSAKPIEIHLPEKDGGAVWGYFNLERHKTASELDRIMKIGKSSAAGGQFVIQGKFVQWNYLKQTLTASPQALVEGLGIWDEMIEGHWELMGIGQGSGQFPAKRNNRQLALSNVNPEAYMHATDYYVFFESKTISARTAKATMFGGRDFMWGPAHEFGHQSDKALSWHGYSEASNNLFSNLSTWQFAQKYNTGFKTRGPGMQLLNHYAYERGLNFMDFPFDQIPTGAQYDSDGLFLELRLAWQLYIYYHILGKNTDFYPQFFALLRANHSPQLEPQERSMQFYKLACMATSTDMTEFFEAWGWFNPIDKVIDQYGKIKHVLTPAMVAAAKSEVASKGYAKALPLQYIEDRNVVDAEDQNWASSLGQVGQWQTFRDNPAILGTICYTRSGDAIAIENGAQAVGFEVRQGGSPSGKLLCFSVRYSFVTSTLTGTNKLYAVRADGTRVEIPRKSY